MRARTAPNFAVLYRHSMDTVRHFAAEFLTQAVLGGTGGLIRHRGQFSEVGCLSGDWMFARVTRGD